MAQNRFAVTPSAMTRCPSRRRLLGGLAAAGFGWAAGRFPDAAEAKVKKKRRKKHQDARPRCTRNGEACVRRANSCRASFCLRAPFTIAAIWQGDNDHDTWLFVPPKDAGTGPGPQIDYDCNQSNSACQTQYPFACVSNDAKGPGDEITTIYERLPGTYEYWLVLRAAPAGELTVVLRDRDGRVARQWSSPAVAAGQNDSWHVFDVDGETGRVTSVDAPPAAFPVPVTNVCPE